MYYEESTQIPVPAPELFAFIDNHKQFSAHMAKSSWMMGGGRMETWVDENNGQKVGSHIRMTGSAFGMKLSLDEVITGYEPPFVKTWQTVGNPSLIVIGKYRMGIEIKSQGGHSLLRVYIEYKLPEKNTWLGRMFGRMYARWCVKQMLVGSHRYFTKGGEDS